MSYRRMGVGSIGAIVAALAAAAAVSALAQAPPQPPPKPHHTPGARTLPSSPNKAVSDGLSLEHECLNAVGATRHSPKMASETDPQDRANRVTANEHLDQAEEAARGGHGQVCEDELGQASDSLK